MTTFLKIPAWVYLLALCASVSFAGEKEDAAAAGALPWLQLVDSGEKAESWFQASSDFRGAVSKEQWIHALDTVRIPLGRMVTRKLKTATYTTKLPNQKSGEYVVIQYDTRYDKAPEMAETVIMVLGKSGTWKVSGYFIKRAGE
jgi:hypothetical protein